MSRIGSTGLPGQLKGGARLCNRPLFCRARRASASIVKALVGAVLSVRTCLGDRRIWWSLGSSSVRYLLCARSLASWAYNLLYVGLGKQARSSFFTAFLQHESLMERKINKECGRLRSVGNQ